MLSGLAVVVASAAPVAAVAADDGEINGLEYVALGDSYSAGFGLQPFSGTSPFEGSPNGCYQAEANYPHLVASELGLAITDETCSGAISANLGYPADTTIPSPPAVGPLTGLPTGSEAQTTMSGMLAPDVQSAALSAETDIVTVAIGGNDLGFSSIAMACVRSAVGEGTSPLYLSLVEGITVDNCKDYFDDPDTYPDTYLKDRLADFVVPRIEATFDRIKAAAPNAQVFVVGYPQIAPEEATDACFTGPGTTDAVPMSGVDIMFIHEIEGLLDDALEAAAIDHGFHFVATWEATAEHTLCQPEPWIWGLTAYINLSADCDPGYIRGDADGWICIKLGALHPNEGGVGALRTAVAAALPSAFFARVVEGTLEPGGTVTIEGGGFHPGEEVELVVHSTPTSLGTVTANASGGFTTTRTVPSSVAPGPHTLTATGLSSGRTFGASLALNMPATGADLGGPAAIAGLLLLLGGGLVLARRARRG